MSNPSLESDFRDPLVIRHANRYLLRMLAFLVLTGLIIWLIHQPLLVAISANPPLNIGIIAVLLLGILYTFGQVINLRPEVKWLNTFRTLERDDLRKTPRLMGPMARLVGDHGGRLSLSPALMRTILDSIGTRLDESRETARYMIGLLIFLGLLGTFWGLLQTVDAVGETIRSLSVGMGPIEDSFEELRLGLEAPLGGMGTAFSSSLIGLAGSLILGFLDLQMGQAQNRFYNDLEEWLSDDTVVDLSAAGVPSAQGGSQESGQGFDQNKLMEAVQYSMNNIRHVSVQLTEMSSHLKAQQTLIGQLTQAQAQILPMLEKSAGMSPQGESPSDQYAEAIYGHLRNLDISMQNLVQLNSEGQGNSVDELKSEIMRLTQAILDLTQGQQ